MVTTLLWLLATSPGLVTRGAPFAARVLVGSKTRRIGTRSNPPPARQQDGSPHADPAAALVVFHVTCIQQTNRELQVCKSHEDGCLDASLDASLVI